MNQKMIILITLILMVLPISADAQSPNDLIVLNDTTPAIDVVINTSPDTTGVVALEVNNASVTITDVVGNIVFETSASDIKAIEFRFAPNAGTHTLTVQRLPGATQAYARIVSLSELSVSETVPDLVTGNTLAVAQETDYPLNANVPSSIVDFEVSEDDNLAMITASFPGAPVTVQLVEVEENRALATLYGSLIDGVRFTVDKGTYELVLLNNNPDRQTVANVSLLPATESDFDTLVAQAEGGTTTTMADINSSLTPPSNTANGSNCAVTVDQSSVNLRSGPGTGYSVLEYAFRGDVMPVGGVNPESGWLLVGTATGSAWVTNNAGSLSGSCANLTAFNIPYREAVAPAVTIQQSQVSVYHDDDGDEHENQYEDDHDDDEHEQENDD